MNYKLLPLLILIITSCARMGSPDGGWFDETPPKVIGATPADKGTNVKSNKVTIYFDEFIKLENASEKVVVSPPQLEQPEIKAAGHRIVVELKDTLKENITYTVDFSDAISDNNEGNPMGNYTYSFSTGDHIDTLEVSGYVLNAEDLEPVKGTLVGLYALPDSTCEHPDSIFIKEPFLRVSRTDSRGRFIIRGIAQGEYRCFALKDIDGDFRFSQNAEEIAFNHDIITPWAKPDIRQDTIWADTLHIRDIKQVGYTHFMPDDIVLRSFMHDNQDRFFLKNERTEANVVRMYFSGPGTMIPELRFVSEDMLALNNDSSAMMPGTMCANNNFIIETSEKKDTITYWLRDTALVNRDSLVVDITYEMTDTLGNIVLQTDSAVTILAKTPYAKRMKQLADKENDWKKKIEKRRKRGEEITDSIMPKEPLAVKYSVESSMSPNGSIRIDLPTPLERIDTGAIHLYVKVDSLWYRSKFELQRVESRYTNDRNLEVIAEWLPGAEYSFEVDTLAFTDIYGVVSDPYKTGLKIREQSSYASLFVNVEGNDSSAVIVQLLDGSDKVIAQSPVIDGTAEFYYLKAGSYYLRAFLDRNNNGIWDTGNYALNLQPEEVYYYKEAVECKEKWDITKGWNLTQTPLYLQKPAKLTKQKGDKKKTIRQRNAERARDKGIELPEYLR